MDADTSNAKIMRSDSPIRKNTLPYFIVSFRHEKHLRI